MKVKKKGKKYSSSSSSSSSSYKDLHTVLKLLPMSILALALALPVPDQQVIAYMITRSIFTTTAAKNPSSNKIKCKKKPNQKDLLFECGCFDCYTSFWYRWDSSPNRDLIHQVIEAFEDHLLQKESPEKHYKQRKRKDKVAMDGFQCNVSLNVLEKEHESTEAEVGDMEEKGDGCEGEEDKVVAIQVLRSRNHKGLTRKVLPDVMGLLNSRFWSLWSSSI